ncbi:unnamed protein product [Trichogramma brassicae]|uniref:Uncharacterized protein n=1 Tax=Trichogramma brassicae TaxID=86971 RepID=A0A6H5IJM4_9HYME|nr:unnamed protein product [Trichogramma brassicae]
MFSGLTSQVSSWMGKKEDGSEDPASAAADPNLAGGAGDGTEATDPLAAGSSPTKGSSKLEMLAGVKSQVASSMSGWLSGGIPGLNRAGATTEAGDTAAATDADATQATTQAQATASNENVKDDDASSATGGADSVGPGSLTGTPTEDKDGQQPFGAGLGWINCLRAVRAILWHDEVPFNLYELVWQSISILLSTHDDVYAGPRCHEETWEPEEEGICPICHRLFSKPPPPAGPWFLAGPWD